VPVYFFAQAKYHIDYPWSKIAGLGLLLAAVWEVRNFADVLPLPLSLAVSLILLFFIAPVIYTCMLDNDEKAFFARVIRHPFALLSARAA